MTTQETPFRGIIIAIVDDLFFLTKIQHAAGTLGVEVKPINPEALAGDLAQTGSSAVILDLNHRSGRALDILRDLKSNPSTSSTRVLGFVSHVQGGLITAARAAGCDTVLARSAFAKQLPQLLKQLAGIP